MLWVLAWERVHAPPWSPSIWDCAHSSQHDVFVRLQGCLSAGPCSFVWSSAEPVPLGMAVMVFTCAPCPPWLPVQSEDSWHSMKEVCSCGGAQPVCRMLWEAWVSSACAFGSESVFCPDTVVGGSSQEILQQVMFPGPVSCFYPFAGSSSCWKILDGGSRLVLSGLFFSLVL
jgi:hypothetical protein